MTPFKVVPRMKFVGYENRSLTAVGQKIPSISVPYTLCALVEGFLDSAAPARLEKLVNIGGNAYIRVLRNEGKRVVSRRVEPPRLDFFAVYSYVGIRGKNFYRVVGAARVENHDLVRLRHTFSPSVSKFLFVFGYGVNRYFVWQNDHLIKTPQRKVRYFLRRIFIVCCYAVSVTVKRVIRFREARS